jgi:hypothetical protein
VKRIDFHPAAREEARDAAARYEGLRAGLGRDFRADLRAALARIRKNPQLYSAEAGSIRLCPLHRFPYSVFYEELTDRIWVAAIGHHSRRPGYWARRRPD